MPPSEETRQRYRDALARAVAGDAPDYAAATRIRGHDDELARRVDRIAAGRSDLRFP